nr:MAG TPA: hypothetical protein [Caudoviricetes sp.]
MPVKSVTLQTVELPNRPCGLSRVQQCECEWRRIECECEQRCIELELEYRLASGNLTIGVQHRGRVPYRGAEGSKPQQKRTGYGKLKNHASGGVW